MDFEAMWGLVPERGVFAVGIVVAIDVVEDFGVGIGGILKDAALEHLSLEGADEGLRPGVLVGVGTARHALAQTGGGESLAEASAAVLAAAVAMEDRLVDW